MSDSVTPCTIAHQAPLSVGFISQKYWSGLPCPPPGDLSDPGIELVSLMSPALAGRFFTTSATWEACMKNYHLQFPEVETKSVANVIKHAGPRVRERVGPGERDKRNTPDA